MQQFVRSNVYSDFLYSREYFLFSLICARPELREEIADTLYTVYTYPHPRLYFSKVTWKRWDCGFLARFSLAPAKALSSSSSPSSFFSWQSPLLDATRTQRNHWRTYGRTAMRGIVHVRCYSMPYAIWLMASALLSVIDSTSRTHSSGSTMPAHLRRTVIASLVKRTSRFLDE